MILATYRSYVQLPPADVIAMDYKGSIAVLLLINCISYSKQQIGSSDLSLCETLYLLNVVPFPNNGTFAGWDKAFELIPAGHLAAKHINDRLDLLQDYKLEVIDVPSEACGRSIIVEGLFHLYAEILGPKKTCVLGIVGLYCSTVTDIIAPIANLAGFVQLAASTSPLHRDNPLLPSLFHTIASSTVFNEAMIGMMNEFHWKRINLLHDSLGFYFQSTASDFVKLIYSESDKELIAKVPVLPQISAISEIFDIINEEEARIGYFSITEGEAATIMCGAYKKNFLWPGYVYTLHERSLSQILLTKVDCTQEEMRKALEGVFLLQYRLFSPKDTVLISGITYEEFHEEYVRELNKLASQTGMDLEDNVYANTLYDQVWAYALALNESNGSVNFINSSYKENGVEYYARIKEELAKELKGVSFNGASGLVQFGNQQEVQTFVEIYQVRNGSQVLIGVFNSYNKSIEFMNDFDKSAVPGDRFDILYDTIPQWLGIIVIICDSILFLLILFNAVSITYWKRQPEIRSGSYFLSLLILIGCFLMCLSPIMQTVQVLIVPNNPTVFSITCNSQVWFFIIGLNLIFVTLLLRLLRIFHVFRSYHSTSKLWSDKYLFLYIILANSVMVTFLVIWMVVDPLHQLTDENYISSAHPPYYLVNTYCSSNSMGVWLTISLSLIGVVMAMAIFLAVQTRHIKRKNFKDTKKVNVFIFSVCIILCTTIPLWLILVTVGVNIGAYVCNVLSDLAVAAVCQFCLFLPKTIPTFYYRWNLVKRKRQHSNGTVISGVNLISQARKTSTCTISTCKASDLIGQQQTNSGGTTGTTIFNEYCSYDQ